MTIVAERLMPCLQWTNTLSPFRRPSSMKSSTTLTEVMWR
jgi:hypothetical protein